MLSTISTVFAHTRCISPSVCLLKSFMQASTFAPSPFSARASAIRSRTCGRQRLAFLAASATGGARKPNPSEGGEGAPARSTELPKCNPRLSPPLAGCPHPSRCSAARSTAPPSPRGRRCAPAPCTEFAICGGRERRFALNMPRSAEKARSFAEKFFILRGFGRRRLDYYGEQRYN